MALLSESERFGSLVVVGLISDNPEVRYRVQCLRCKSDCVTATEAALLSGRVMQCWDCDALAKMTPHQRVVAAFRRKLDLSPPGEVLDYAA